MYICILTSVLVGNIDLHVHVQIEKNKQKYNIKMFVTVFVCLEISLLILIYNDQLRDERRRRRWQVSGFTIVRFTLLITE